MIPKNSDAKINVKNSCTIRISNVRLRMLHTQFDKKLKKSKWKKVTEAKVLLNEDISLNQCFNVEYSNFYQKVKEKIAKTSNGKKNLNAKYRILISCSSHDEEWKYIEDSNIHTPGYIATVPFCISFNSISRKAEKNHKIALNDLFLVGDYFKNKTCKVCDYGKLLGGAHKGESGHYIQLKYVGTEFPLVLECFKTTNFRICVDKKKVEDSLPIGEKKDLKIRIKDKKKEKEKEQKKEEK